MPADVLLAHLHGDTVAASFHKSVVALLTHDVGHHQRLAGTLPVACASSGIVSGRNQTAARFLDDTDAEYLFVVDADMGFAPDTLDRLLESADATDRPVVAALAFAWVPVADDGLHGVRCQPVPVIYDYTTVAGREGQCFATVSDYPRDTLVRCAATGSACILIHRSALEAVRQRYGDTWYTRLPTPDGDYLGEDISFAARLGACGIPVHVHTGVRTSHAKTIYVSDRDHLPAP